MSKARLPIVAGIISGAALICVAAFVMQAQHGTAQGVTPMRPAGGGGGGGAAAGNEIKVNSNGLTDISRGDCLQSAPRLGNTNTARQQRKWGVFDVTFDTGPEWIDEMSVTFMVMLDNEKAKQGEKRMSLYTDTFNYTDVKQGRDHKAGVVLPPNLVERYGRPIGFAVMITVNGQSAGDGYGMTAGSLKGQEKWWLNSNITGSQNVQKKTGLVERSKSVFALVDVDAYEVAK